MPEGHTIHRYALDHSKVLTGQVLEVSSPQGRFAAEARKLSGTALRRIEAHGKHLFYHWDKDRVVHIHLGLAGRFRTYGRDAPSPSDVVRLRMVSAGHTVDLTGPMICELLSLRAAALVRNRLGPDPLKRGADQEAAWEKVRRSRRCIGALLMDQSVISGVGNIYRAEILFACAIHPDRRGTEITEAEAASMWSGLVRWMRIGVQRKKILTAAADSKDTAAGFYAYKRDCCVSCHGPIRAWKLGGRMVYACENCQA